MTASGAAVIASQPPLLAAAPNSILPDALPVGSNLAGTEVGRLKRTNSRFGAGHSLFASAQPAPDACRAYCCAGQATQHNSDQQIFNHGGLSMYEAIKQSAFEITFVVVGLVLASSIPLAVVFFYLAMN